MFITRYLTLFFALSLYSISFSQSNDFLAFEKVQLTQDGNKLKVDFSLRNKKNKDWSDLVIQFSSSKSVLRRQSIPKLSSETKLQTFSWDIDLPANKSTDFKLEITSAFGLHHTIALWQQNTEKQANTVGSEFYADAPHRMLKADPLGNIQGIPVSFLLHDANSVGFNVNIDNINLQVKNSTDANYGPVLTYNTLPTFDFLGRFSNLSTSDNIQNIQEFNPFSLVSSPIKTMDFNLNSNSFGQFISINRKFWYFTFTIPPASLAGMNDVIDIKVTVEYSNLTFADEVFIMRVFRESEKLPTIPGYYRGDTHLHSIYTNNSAEIGFPLKATKQAAALSGLNWITTTDHSSDYDNYGADVQTNWTRINSEIASMNAADSSFIFIAGLEAAVKNSDSKLIHLLSFPNPLLPYSMPFIGDANGDVVPTGTTAASALSSIHSYNGFSYMAHPFATGDALPTIPVNGGIWNIGNANFPANGNAFPNDGGNIICNNLSKSTDLLGDLTTHFIKDGVVGGEIWNTRFSLNGSGDSNNPWSGSGSFAPVDTNASEHHIRRFRQGQEVIKFLNISALKAKNLNPNLQNWKMFYSAGSDAHGSFNYSNTNDFLSLGSISNSSVGDISTAVYCPNGMGSNGKNILQALKDGNSTLSDGPILVLGVSRNGPNSGSDLIMGQDGILDASELSVAELNLQIATTAEYGNITRLILFLGTDSLEFSDTLVPTNLNGSQTISLNLKDWMDTVLGAGNFVEDKYVYVRGELQTRRFFNPQEQIERKISHETYHSFTNPIWVKHYNNVGLSNLANEKISIFPNPTASTLNISWEDVTDFSIKITDLSGKIVKSEKSNSTTKTIDIHSLPAGNYTIELESGEIKISKSVVKVQ